VPLAALFTVLTLSFGGIAVAAALAGQWAIALASGALAAWTATLVSGAVRKRRK
jgi:hypothetical protein